MLGPIICVENYRLYYSRTDSCPAIVGRWMHVCVHACMFVCVFCSGLCCISITKCFMLYFIYMLFCIKEYVILECHMLLKFYLIKFYIKQWSFISEIRSGGNIPHMIIHKGIHTSHESQIQFLMRESLSWKYVSMIKW